ncbi:hypothetical protein SAMN05216271_3466 [Halopseudomonas sabulinigri]|uniref:Class I SAM-dependent methyltransferase n=1 Tax=Halopseudomonas sabulinigri TaxID=472181 RepID=A0A1H1X8G2_9GAMM|nr:DUF6231 family protein [Halopseudomonas sabulinigri]SDT05512.1 hypothetical protein SAMN05216271_3466 [Halopseudomonas sabulinigri]
MTATPNATLLSILEHYQPARLLCVSQSRVPAVEAYCATHPATQLVTSDQAPLPAGVANQRYDLAIIADQLEHVPQRTGVELLAGLRNLSASRLAVLVDLLQAADWQENDFFALALQRRANFTGADDQRTLSLYTYDLADYKQVPDWLNSKYWANPEMFDKYWW